MKIQKVTQLTLAALIALSAMNVEAAPLKSTKHHRFIEILRTTNKKILNNPYYQVKSVVAKELTDEESLEFVNEEAPSALQPKILSLNKDFAAAVTPAPAPAPAPGSGIGGVKSTLDNVIMVVDKLIAIGAKIMPTINQGRPVVTNNPMAAVSVLPRSDAKDQAVQDMGGWSIPVSRHYRIAYKNGFGSEVIVFVYSITFQYNGNADGKGKYITGLRASARNVSVSYGFDLGADSQLIAISNVGTQKDVIAGATLEMNYRVKNLARDISEFVEFHVTGDGRLFKLD